MKAAIFLLALSRVWAGVTPPNHGRPAGGGRPKQGTGAHTLRSVTPHHNMTAASPAASAHTPIGHAAVTPSASAHTIYHPTAAHPPQAHNATVATNDPSVNANDPWIPAFRFRASGIVECLLRGDSAAAAGAYLLAKVTSDPATREYTAKLPHPRLMEPGAYAVRCVRIYGDDIKRAVGDVTARWQDCRSQPGSHHYKGAQFDGTILEPAAPRDEDKGRFQCSNISGRVLGLSDRAALAALAGRSKHDGCPGVIADAALLDDSWGQGPQWVFDGPPAVVRVPDPRHPGHTLPRCAAAFDLPGRWLPAATARLVVINGASIPASRDKFWVPYGCRTTYWDLPALKAVAGQTTTGSPCLPPLGESGVSDACLRCNLGALRRVVFTGRSTSAVLMAALREHVLLEAHETAARDKDADHLREVSGGVLAETKASLGALASGAAGSGGGPAIEFITMPQTMPVVGGRDRAVVAAERRKQIKDLHAQFAPSAFVIHVGLHEVCGAYGPEYDKLRLNVGHCASRAELMETYEDYASEVASLGMSGRTLFRSLMGGYPDVGRSGPWRWAGFADAAEPFGRERDQGLAQEVPAKGARAEENKGAAAAAAKPAWSGADTKEGENGEKDEKGIATAGGNATPGTRTPWQGNQCPAILGPIADAIFAGGDAARAWGRHGSDGGGGSGVKVVDAFSPFQASPTRAKVMSDGLHPNTASDEALAVNQAIMNALCAMDAEME